MVKADRMPKMYTPAAIVIDLSNDGFDLIPLKESRIFFDVMNNGEFVFHTGWVSPSDGFLSIDLNGNGKIDNSAELLSSMAGLPVEEIRDNYDTNHNGKLDVNDYAFGTFSIWVDKNSNGRTDTAELFSLREMNISEISLKGIRVDRKDKGHTVKEEFEVLTSQGGYYTAAEVLIENETANSRPAGDSVTVLLEGIFLPHVRGYGIIADMHVAMTSDRELFNMMKNISKLQTNQLSRYHDDLHRLLLRWAKVDGMSADGNGPHMDSRVAAFTLKMAGYPADFVFGKKNYSAAEAKKAMEPFNKFFNRTAAIIAVQSIMSRVFPRAKFNLAQDSLQLGEASFDQLLVRARGLAPTDREAALVYWQLFRNIILEDVKSLGIHQNQVNVAVEREVAKIR